MAGLWERREDGQPGFIAAFLSSAFYLGTDEEGEEEFPL